mmetsp:Transcript_50004/g.159940  ORF Transcript_50004/g.159940 Transcript_50004/m.159940 type:complete len:247 (-) Transcript_50004:775-1515(-)
MRRSAGLAHDCTVLAVAHSEDAAASPELRRAVPGISEADLQVRVRQDPAAAAGAACGDRGLGHEAVPRSHPVEDIGDIRPAWQADPLPEGAAARLMPHAVECADAPGAHVSLSILGSIRGQGTEATWKSVYQCHHELWEIVLEVAGPLHTLIVSTNHKHTGTAVVQCPQAPVLLQYVPSPACHRALVQRWPSAHLLCPCQTRGLPQGLASCAKRCEAAARGHDAIVESHSELWPTAGRGHRCGTRP